MMRLSAPIYQLKRRAKSLVRDEKIACMKRLIASRVRRALRDGACFRPV